MWKHRENTVHLGSSDTIDPETMAALKREIDRDYKRAVAVLNGTLYPRAGERDAAIERLDDLSGL